MFALCQAAQTTPQRESGARLDSKARDPRECFVKDGSGIPAVMSITTRSVTAFFMKRRKLFMHIGVSVQ